MSGIQREGYAEEWVKYESSLPGPVMPKGKDPSFSAAFDKMMVENAATFPPPPAGVTARDEKIDEHIIVRIYQPAKDNARSLPKPAIVFFHGGGYVAGNLDTEDHFCQTICGQADVVIISVLYRKFPQIRFPENMQDCFDGFQWAYNHASEIGADQQRFLIMGGSAGGGLAVATTYNLARKGFRDRLFGLILLCSSHLHPSAVPPEYAHLYTAMEENGGAIPFVTAEMAQTVINLLGGEPPYNEETKHFFPVSMGAKGVELFPATWVFDTEKDCMRDDGLILEAELRDAGIRVKREVVCGLPHFYWCFPLPDAAADFRARVIGGIEWVLDSDR